MFYGVVVDVIEVPLKISVIMDQMFPEPPLPNGGFPMFGPGCRPPISLMK